MIDPLVKEALDSIRSRVDALERLLTAPDLPLPSPTGTTLKLLQWNCHHDALGTDGKYDPDRFADWVGTMAPDIISLNEVSSQKTADGFGSRFTTRLKTPLMWTYDGRGNALYGRSSLFMPDAPFVLRAPTAAAAGHTANATVLGCHLSLNQSERRDEIDAIVNLGRDLVLGDFNMQPGSPEYQAMAVAYNDAWVMAETHLGDGNTKNTRIDYVWVKKSAAMRVVEARIVDLRTITTEPWPSDHKPLLVTVTL